MFGEVGHSCENNMIETMPKLQCTHSKEDIERSKGNILSVYSYMIRPHNQ
jgi:hypothetical protein